MSDSASSQSIAAVVVTRNRLALLQECIAALRAQTRALDAIWVIDNDSDDGTREWLGAQSDLQVVHQGNLGGAGGFHRGLKEAYRAGHDWFWLLDDDTIACPDALERLCAAPHFKDQSAGYLSSTVRWTDGSLHKMNMVDEHRAPGLGWMDTVLRDRCVPVEIATFVSLLVNRRAVAKVGLPLREFFIWSDDIEYTHRIAQRFRCYGVLDSMVIHKTPHNKDGGVSGLEPGEWWKLRYGYRNYVAFLRRRRDGKWRDRRFRALGVANFLARNIYFVWRARAPWNLIWALFCGLWFNPRVEKVAPDKD